MLGVSYLLLGVLGISPTSWLVIMTTQGIAWGVIAVSYFLAVLGDLSSSGGSKERFYVLGGIIPLVMVMLFSGVSDLYKLNPPTNPLSSALGILIIVSIYPILRASETLPETKIRERRLREHVQKVGKLAEESRKTN